jgi:hypothetical protein
MASAVDSTKAHIVPQMTSAVAARTDIERKIETFAPSVLSHLKQIYESLTSGSPLADTSSSKKADAKSDHHRKIDREAVSNFLETVQRDHPSVAAKSSSLRNLLAKKGGDAAASSDTSTAEESDLGHGDLNDFLAYMSSQASNAEASIVEPAARNLRLPLSNYFISSSHNTYLTGNQLYSESSTDAYKNVCYLPCPFLVFGFQRTWVYACYYPF